MYKDVNAQYRDYSYIIIEIVLNNIIEMMPKKIKEVVGPRLTIK